MVNSIESQATQLRATAVMRRARVGVVKANSGVLFERSYNQFKRIFLHRHAGARVVGCES
jgi:hypothetical protein